MTHLPAGLNPTLITEALVHELEVVSKHLTQTVASERRYAVTCWLSNRRMVQDRKVSGETPNRSLRTRIWRTLSFRLPDRTSEITP